MSDILNISQCNVAQIIGESNRFLFHVFLVHVTTCLIEGKKNIFGEELFKTLLITSIAIALYHIFFRKIIEPNVEKMKLICFGGTELDKKKQKLVDQDLIKPLTKYGSEEKIKVTSKRIDPTTKRIDTIDTIDVKPKKSEESDESREFFANTPGNYSKRQRILSNRKNRR